MPKNHCNIKVITSFYISKHTVTLRSITSGSESRIKAMWTKYEVYEAIWRNRRNRQISLFNIERRAIRRIIFFFFLWWTLLVIHELYGIKSYTFVPTIHKNPICAFNSFEWEIKTFMNLYFFPGNPSCIIFCFLGRKKSTLSLKRKENKNFKTAILMLKYIKPLYNLLLEVDIYLS